MSKKQKTVLAIASAGGHWVQLQRLRPAFEGCRLIFATTRSSYQSGVSKAEFRTVPEANRWSKWSVIKSAFGILFLILRDRPDVIVSTGAAPGYLAVRIGSLMGKKTIWIDSIANAEELSLSGKKAGKCVDLWLTQWEHLAQPDGPHYFGNVIE